MSISSFYTITIFLTCSQEMKVMKQLKYRLQDFQVQTLHLQQITFFSTSVPGETTKKVEHLHSIVWTEHYQQCFCCLVEMLVFFNALKPAENTSMWLVDSSSTTLRFLQGEGFVACFLSFLFSFFEISTVFQVYQPVLLHLHTGSFCLLSKCIYHLIILSPTVQGGERENK